MRIHVRERWVEMPDGSLWSTTPRRIAVLAALARKPYRLVTYEAILTAMYGGPDFEPEHPESVMKSCICHLRRCGMPISTRWGQGYILTAAATVIDSAAA